MTVLFSADQPSASTWTVVVDGVMGGCSTGKAAHPNGLALEFRGHLSRENNGGFSSVRSPALTAPLDDCQALRVHARGDGRTYRLVVRTGEDGVGWQSSFTPAKDGSRHDFLLADLQPRRRGKAVTAKPLRGADIVAVGFLLADGIEGPFQLDVVSIDALSTLPTSRDN